MGRTALYRDPEVWTPPRAVVQLDADVLVICMPDGWVHRCDLDGCSPWVQDACYSTHDSRRFVRMLVLDPQTTLITPPDRGAVAPAVVPMPEAPVDAAIIDTHTWDVVADWVLCGGRLGAHTIGDLARLSTIATSAFASLIGEVAARHALELSWAARGPLRGGAELEISLTPFILAARTWPRAAEALVSAFAYAAGRRRRRRG